MADYNSSLPIRTEANGDAAVKVVDGTTPSQALNVDSSGRVIVKVQDAGGDALVISGAGAASVEVTAALPAGNNNIGDVDANMRDGAGTSLTSTLVNSKQSLDVQTSAHGTDGAAVPFGTMQVGGTDGTNLQALSTDTSGKLKVDIHDATGTAFSAGNPLPVTVVSATPGDEVLDFDQAVAVAAGASDTHTYTPSTGTTLTLQKIAASASSKMKVEIKIGPTGSEVTKVVLFNSTANPNVEYEFSAPQALTDADSILVIRTNKDNQAQDLYSTIEGVEN